jgi:hypothetical protein
MPIFVEQSRGEREPDDLSRRSGFEGLAKKLEKHATALVFGRFECSSLLSIWRSTIKMRICIFANEFAFLENLIRNTLYFREAA